MGVVYISYETESGEKTVIPAKVTILGILLTVSASASAGAEYNDNYLTRSMQLQMIESVYDEGVSKGFGTGKHLTADQVSSLNKSVGEMKVTVEKVNDRVDHLQKADIQVLGATNMVISAANKTADARIKAAEDRASVIVDAASLHNSAESLHKSVKTLKVADAGMVDAAKKVYDEKVQMANERAARIITKAESDARRKLTDGKTIMEAPVSCNIRDEPLLEVLRCLTPAGWDMDPQVKNKEILGRLTSFVSTSPRYIAFKELFDAISGQTKKQGKQVNLKASFYPNLFDEAGTATPLVVISEEE